MDRCRRRAGRSRARYTRDVSVQLFLPRGHHLCVYLYERARIIKRFIVVTAIMIIFIIIIIICSVTRFLRDATHRCEMDSSTKRYGAVKQVLHDPENAQSGAASTNGMSTDTRVCSVQGGSLTVLIYRRNPKGRGGAAVHRGRFGAGEKVSTSLWFLAFKFGKTIFTYLQRVCFNF